VYLSLLAATTGGGVDPGPFIVRDNVQLDHPTTCVHPIWIGDHGRPVGRVEITGNTLFSYSNGVSIGNATGVDISGNTIKVGGGGCFTDGTTDPYEGRRGALLWNVTDARVTMNTFLEAGEVAKVENSTGVQVCSNRFSTTEEYHRPTRC
jgi:nitrous oxidase accessory protein NosD